MIETDIRFSPSDKGKVCDYLALTKQRVETRGSHAPLDLVTRKLALQRLRDEIRALLTHNHLEVGAESDWKELDKIAKNLQLENFTKQTPDDGDVHVISRGDLKSHDYVSRESTERRTYVGLHREPYDNDGLSVVTAYKPPLYTQPFHAHSMTAENTLAMDITNGLIFTAEGAQSTQSVLTAQPGRILHFPPLQAHTLENPSLGVSVDVSVKVPQALEDRVTLTTESLPDFLSQTQDRAGRACIKEPQYEARQTGVVDYAHLAEDCARRYFVHCITMSPGAVLQMARLGAANEGTVEILQLFGGKEILDVDLHIDTGSKNMAVVKGDVVIIPNSLCTYVVTNKRTSPATLYRAYEV